MYTGIDKILGNSGEGKFMELDYSIGLVIALFLMGYLVYSLLEI